jgi:hypothetical protein
MGFLSRNWSGVQLERSRLGIPNASGRQGISAERGGSGHTASGSPQAHSDGLHGRARRNCARWGVERSCAERVKRRPARKRAGAVRRDDCHPLRSWYVAAEPDASARTPDDPPVPGPPGRRARGAGALQRPRRAEQLGENHGSRSDRHLRAPAPAQRVGRGGSPAGRGGLARFAARGLALVLSAAPKARSPGAPSRAARACLRQDASRSTRRSRG